MGKVLLVYGTSEGQTKKVAEEIGRTLVKEGLSYDIAPGEAAPKGEQLKAYSAVIAGSSVHAGHFNKEVMAWAIENAQTLKTMPSAFFSVCLGILEDSPKARADERQILTDLFEITDWHPKYSAIFAGALKYSQYNWLKKWIMKRIVAKAGGDTDTSRDYEYTDWNEVKAFAERFARDLGAAA